MKIMQFLYKGLDYLSQNLECSWHKKTYSIEEVVDKGLGAICDIHDWCSLIAIRQSFGLLDSKGLEVYEGDIISCTVRLPGERMDFEIHAGTVRFCTEYFDLVIDVEEGPLH